MSTLIVLFCVIIIVLLAIRSIKKKKKCSPDSCFGCTKCEDFSSLKEQYYKDCKQKT